MYKAPNINRTIFNDFFYNLFLKYINSEIFICGDFNIDFVDVFNPFTIDFNNTISQLGLNNLIKIPTRLSTYKNSLIDNILTNSNSILLNGVINTYISDHSVVFTTLNITNNYTKSCDYVYIRNMHNINAFPVSKVIKDRNQITIEQVIRLQSWGYVLITITYHRSITISDYELITISDYGLITITYHRSITILN